MTVESEGKSVDLAAAEGVEVPLGKPPGEKFTAQRDQVDYSKWTTLDSDVGMKRIEEAAQKLQENGKPVNLRITYGKKVAPRKKHLPNLTTYRSVSWAI